VLLDDGADAIEGALLLLPHELEFALVEEVRVGVEGVEHALDGRVGQLPRGGRLRSPLLHQIHDLGQRIQAALPGGLTAGTGQQGASHENRGRHHHPHPIALDETGHEAPG